MTAKGSLVPPPLDVRRFDLRVARVEHILEHPELVSKLFIQNMIYYDKIKEPEAQFKLCINKVANHYSKDIMDDKMVVVLCNTRPIVLHGIISRMRMLCATTNNKLELLIPPKDSVEGDEIIVDGYPREPEKPFMMPVEKPFEIISMDFRVNANKQAVYKGNLLRVKGKGFITTETLSDCPICFE